MANIQIVLDKIGFVGAVLMIGSLVFMSVESAIINGLITKGGYFPIMGLLLFILGTALCLPYRILYGHQ